MCNFLCSNNVIKNCDVKEILCCVQINETWWLPLQPTSLSLWRRDSPVNYYREKWLNYLSVYGDFLHVLRLISLCKTDQNIVAKKIRDSICKTKNKDQIDSFLNMQSVCMGWHNGLIQKLSFPPQKLHCTYSVSMF